MLLQSARCSLSKNGLCYLLSDVTLMRCQWIFGFVSFLRDERTRGLSIQLLCLLLLLRLYLYLKDLGFTDRLDCSALEMLGLRIYNQRFASLQIPGRLRKASHGLSTLAIGIKVIQGNCTINLQSWSSCI